MKVVAFNGSPRTDGNTEMLLKLALAELEAEGIETELVKIGGKPIRGCAACYKCGKNKNGRCVIEDDMINDCIAKMVAADGVLLGSPTYFADVTTEMKALIDRAGLVTRMNDNLLARKVGAALVAVRRGGSIHAFDTMNHLFLISEMIVPGSMYWNMGFGSAEGDVEQDKEGVSTAKTLGKNMAWLMKKMHDGE